MKNLCESVLSVGGIRFETSFSPFTRTFVNEMDFEPVSELSELVFFGPLEISWTLSFKHELPRVNQIGSRLKATRGSKIIGIKNIFS